MMQQRVTFMKKSLLKIKIIQRLEAIVITQVKIKARLIAYVM